MRKDHSFVLGLLLFLIFVNDLESNPRNVWLKIADCDQSIWKSKQCCCIRATITRWLELGCDWANRRQTGFNDTMCNYSYINIGNGNTKFQYSMQWRQLDTVGTARNLGVHVYILSNLKSAESDVSLRTTELSTKISMVDAIRHKSLIARRIGCSCQ